MPIEVANSPVPIGEIEKLAILEDLATLDPIPVGPAEKSQKGPISIIKPTSYQKLLELAGIWHIRLGHIGLKLLKKTAKFAVRLPNLSTIKD